MKPMLSPGQRLGDYVCEKQLGAGAMSEVWRATKNGTGQPVVIKRLHDHLTHDPRQIDRFVDEAELAHRLVHPNLARVQEVSNDAGIWFLVMDWVDGVELRTGLVVEPGPMKPALAAHIAAQAAAGIAYAQARKDAKGRTLAFVHRDIAPDNLMIDVDGRVRVVDFGLARVRDTGVTTQTGLRKGKLRYMSREYLRDHAFDSSTDVYALGATLFEMLTGARPFYEASGPVDLMHVILTSELPRASALRPSVPKELSDLVFDATRANPAARTRTAAELLDRLDRFGAKYPGPSAEQLGALVKTWRRLARSKKSRHAYGEHGQLETTEAIEVAPPELPLRRRKNGSTSGLGSSVIVAHQTDLTEERTAPDLAPFQEDRPTQKFEPFAREPKVIVERQTTGRRKRRR
ncbi:MAG: serine/threonine protein kinase [Myxococcaceae bacterium]|nr:serine/threonine protein kinase [Myxococcaceae bacterium]